MLPPFHRLRGAARALARYGNPVSLALQRALRRPVHHIADRATGVRLRSRAAAARMMTETYHQHVYDLPAVPLRAGDLVLDIGANHGFYTVYAARQGATVHAFEPSPSLQAFLRDNLQANGVESRVIVHPCALGAADGEISFFESEEMGGGMNTSRPEFVEAFHGQQQYTETRVPCRRLGDALAEALGGDPDARVRLVKMDCEGSELEILAGLTPAELARIDGFAIEYHPEAYPLETLLDLVLAWPGFHFSRLPPGEVVNSMFHLTSQRALKEGLARQFDWHRRK